jgi:hypothetical protein
MPEAMGRVKACHECRQQKVGPLFRSVSCAVDVCNGGFPFDSTYAMVRRFWKAAFVALPESPGASIFNDAVMPSETPCFHSQHA